MKCKKKKLSLVKKNSITDKVLMKQKRILIIAVFCVITLLISSSYALLTNFDKTDDVITFKTGNLNMTVNNTLVNLSGNLPEGDENGLLNAAPISLTLTNTGTMFIDGYEVMLVGDSSQTSTLNEKYIKYAISEDGTTYSTPSILTKNNNIIYTGYDLEVDASKTIYLKVWIDEAAGNYALNKTYYGSVEVKLYQKKEQPSYEMIKSIAKSKQTDTCKTYVEEDEITYISGTADCIDFNYVWYSGRLWRITAIYPDGSMKMVTENLMTTLEWGANTTYSTSYIKEWLNQEFLPTLYNYENIIVTDAGWYSIEDSSSPPSKPTGNYTLTSPVGLLNSYEYYKAYQNASTSTNYLYNTMTWFLITPYNDSNVTVAYNTGVIANRDPDEYARGVRPVIILKSTIKLSGGNGSYNNPYKINEDNLEIKDNITLLNTRQSGEYVKFGNNTVNNVFRIVGTELVGDKLTTKLILNDYFRDDSGNLVKKYFADDSVYGDGSGTDYWDYYLNNTYLNTLDSSMLEKGTYYTTPYDVGKTGGYKKIVCSSVDSNKSISDCIKEGNIVSNKWTGFVGFPRYGDVFAAQTLKYSNTQQFFLINTIATDISYQWYIIGQNNLNSAKNTQQAARPTINLTSSVVIKSGSGTEKEPFVVGLPSE